MRVRGVRRTHRGADLGDAEARRRLHRSPQRRPAGGRTARRPAGDPAVDDPDRSTTTGRAVAGARRRVAVRLPAAGHPLRRPAPCRRRAGTGCQRRPWPRSPSWSGPPVAARSGCSRSRRAAETAAVHVRKQLPKLTILCQGDAQLPELTRRFVADEQASLFGTLSLWQGVDVPGATCQLVIIDRIPFPRPDEPLTLARQRAVAEAGGNGFMAVAATHAALLLAQGSGRLIRRLSDRGVVAVLDSAAGHRPLRRLPAGLDAGHVADHRPGGRHRRAAPARRQASRRRTSGPDCSLAIASAVVHGRLAPWSTPTISTWR